MVKIFVGNLAESVGSERLRNLFQEHVQVQECDVLKSYAFVHVNSEEEADVVIEKFDKYKLEGKELHVERSTSHLRKQPGMSDKCFTCGAEEHKTSQCPKNPSNRKRNNHHHHVEPLIKKPRPLVFANVTPLEEVRIQMAPQPPMFMQQQQQQPQMMQQQPISQQQCWGYKIGGGSETDPELPCPSNPELHRLYEQYMESRTRYFFYREQLTKEMRMQPQTVQSSTSLQSMTGATSLNYGSAANGIPSALADQQLQQQQSVFRVDLTQLVRPGQQTMSGGRTSTLLVPEQQNNQPFTNSSNSIHQSVIPNATAYSSSTNNNNSGYSTIGAGAIGGGLATANLTNSGGIHQSYAYAVPPAEATATAVKYEPNIDSGGPAQYTAAAYPNNAAADQIAGYQTTYTGTATHYNTLPAQRQLQAAQPTMAAAAPVMPPKPLMGNKQPTPLFAVQPFGNGYNG